MERLILWFGCVVAGVFLRKLTDKLEVTSVWGSRFLSGHSPALVGVTVLICAGFVSLFIPSRGRYLAAAGIFLVTLLWFPSILNLAAHPWTLLSWVNLMVIAVYFSSVAFVLLYPTPLRWWTPQLMALMVTIPIIAAFGSTLFLLTDYFRKEAGTKEDETVIYRNITDLRER